MGFRIPKGWRPKCSPVPPWDNSFYSGEGRVGKDSNRIFGICMIYRLTSFIHLRNIHHCPTMYLEARVDQMHVNIEHSLIRILFTLMMGCNHFCGTDWASLEKGCHSCLSERDEVLELKASVGITVFHFPERPPLFFTSANKRLPFTTELQMGA